MPDCIRQGLKKKKKISVQNQKKEKRKWFAVGTVSTFNKNAIGTVIKYAVGTVSTYKKYVSEPRETKSYNTVAKQKKLPSIIKLSQNYCKMIASPCKD